MNKTPVFGWQRLVQALALFALMAGLGAAQSQEVDPPGRAGRLADVEGQVWLYTPDAGEWAGAVRNQPIAAGDRLATDPGARVELQVGSTTLRFDSGSELEVTRLDDDRFALTLRDGSAWVRVRDIAAAGRFEVTTDEGRFIALQAGTYRIDRRAGRSDLTVYAGQARYDGPNSAIAIEPGQRAQFFLDAAGAAQYSLLTPVSDVFASWSSDRDRRAVATVAERYVSPEMTGAAELDAYGRWEPDPEVGTLWFPTAVAADWAPYSAGHWTYVQPWGWSWVDDAPWGFAPFHYGRWLYARGRWGWTPGARVARPVYAPALVAWVGGPGGRPPGGFAGGPPVGWLPLAPREVYVPGYRVSRGYARNLNAAYVNVDVIDNVYANPERPREFGNRLAPRAFTVVPSEVLTGRRPVGPAAAQYRQAPWTRDWAARPGGMTPVLAPPVALPPPGRAGDGRPGAPGQFVPPVRAGDRPGIEARPGERPAFEGRPGDRRAAGDRPAFDNRGGERPAIDARPAFEGRPGERFGVDGRGADRPAWPGRGGERPAAPVVQPAPAITSLPAQAPNRPSVVQAPANPRPAQEGPTMQALPMRRAAEEPTMRPFPVRRDDERHSGGDDRRGQPRSEAVTGAPVRPPVAPAAPAVVERPRPVEAPRAVEAPRPVEAARPPQPQPQAAPPPRGEGRPGRDDRRPDPQR